ncbi:methyltransferase type 12 [Colletotrichum incanum]|uniref:Methyltransferase type 12 n=1 Tax=Colletotrichum incanum TaxID=1573173 RepID=A0A167CD65_COLIC|nr:methyltransferase type 12 [Colletotrichum incanum]
MTIEEQPEHFNNARKADFKSIYNQPDPRAYFAALTPLKYQIPDHALPFVNRVIELSSSTHQTSTNGGAKSSEKILDVCCSYGINAALLRHDLDLESMATHYASNPKLSAREQVAADKRFFASRQCHSGIEIVGLDVAPEPISYAVETGLLASGFAENLETADPSPALRSALRDVNVVVCTGGVGYVSTPTFSRIAACVRDPENLWMVTFVLRVFSFEEVADKLREEHGLVTEKVEGMMFRQRQFTSSEEQKAAVEDVRRKGLDESGLEGDGWFWAECWVTRPRGTEVAMKDILDGRVGTGIRL